MTTKQTSDTFKTGDARYGLMARLTGAIIIGLVFLAAVAPAQAIKLVSNFEQNGGRLTTRGLSLFRQGCGAKVQNRLQYARVHPEGIRVGTYGGGIFNVRICTSVNLGSGGSSGPRSCTALNRPGNQDFDPRDTPKFTPSRRRHLHAVCQQRLLGGDANQ